MHIHTYILFIIVFLDDFFFHYILYVNSESFDCGQSIAKMHLHIYIHTHIHIYIYTYVQSAFLNKYIYIYVCAYKYIYI
jgi:hypothetical protein